MPPRGRPRKTGLKREDAAIDAMKLYGFEGRLISKTLKELLDVYGDDGWIFIEEGSYKVLLEALLEKANQDDENKAVKCLDGGSKMTSCSTSNSPTTNAIASREAADDAEQALAVAALPAILTTSQIDENANPSVTNFETGSSKLEAKKVTSEDNGYTKAVTRSSTRNFVAARVPADITVAARRRRPCYGWIDDSDDHDPEDTIELTPEPLSEELEKLLRSEVKGEKKRKRRWDLKPEDLPEGLH